MDWLPTFLAMACVDDNKEQLFEGGVQENGREYKVYLNGYNRVVRFNTTFYFIFNLIVLREKSVPVTP
jgi:hypothetical protein